MLSFARQSDVSGSLEPYRETVRRMASLSLDLEVTQSAVAEFDRLTDQGMLAGDAAWDALAAHDLLERVDAEGVTDAAA